MDPLVPQDVSARGEDHQEDNHDAEEDEGDGAEGDILQVAASQRSGHWWQLPVWRVSWRSLQPSQPCQAPAAQRLLRGEVSGAELSLSPSPLTSVIFLPAPPAVSSRRLRLSPTTLCTGNSASSWRRSRSSRTRSGTTRSPEQWRATGSLLPWCWTGCVWSPTPPSPSWPRWRCWARPPTCLSRHSRRWRLSWLAARCDSSTQNISQTTLSYISYYELNYRI